MATKAQIAKMQSDLKKAEADLKKARAAAAKKTCTTNFRCNSRF
jgi:hypothetical protein